MLKITVQYQSDIQLISPEIELGHQAHILESEREREKEKCIVEEDETTSESTEIVYKIIALFKVTFIADIVTKSDEFVQSRRFICNTWLINIFQGISSVLILK